jgi:hypothetical protein
LEEIKQLKVIEKGRNVDIKMGKAKDYGRILS